MKNYGFKLVCECGVRNGWNETIERMVLSADNELDAKTKAMLMVPFGWNVITTGETKDAVGFYTFKN